MSPGDSLIVPLNVAIQATIFRGRLSFDRNHLAGRGMRPDVSSHSYKQTRSSLLITQNGSLFKLSNDFNAGGTCASDAL